MEEVAGVHVTVDGPKFTQQTNPLPDTVSEWNQSHPESSVPHLRETGNINQPSARMSHQNVEESLSWVTHWVRAQMPTKADVVGR
jgi:hypothetical protein